MAISKYFDNYGNTQEQRLFEDLITESIRQYGHNLYYVPRTLRNEDQIYREDSVHEYNDAFLVEMYLKSVNGFEGDGLFISKFGFEIRDEITLTVSRKAFDKEVT